MLNVQCDYARGYVGDTVQSYNNVTVGRSIAESRSPEILRNEAVEKAKDADYVIIFGGLNKSNHQDCEGSDREDYGLPYQQNELVEVKDLNLYAAPQVDSAVTDSRLGTKK